MTIYITWAIMTLFGNYFEACKSSFLSNFAMQMGRLSIEMQLVLTCKRGIYNKQKLGDEGGDKTTYRVIVYFTPLPFNTGIRL